MDHPFRRALFARFMRGSLGTGLVLLTLNPAQARLRRVLMARMLGTNGRRWATYFLLSGVWAQYRKLSRREPELVYRDVLGSGARFSMATSDPLPRRLRTKKVQQALEAAARADLA